MNRFLQRLPLFLANSVVIATLIILFGWLVREDTKGRDWIPHSVSRALTFTTTLPDRLIIAKEAMERLPLVFVPTEEDFEPINKLDEDVVILTSYANENWQRKIALINLRNGKELKSWLITRLANQHNRIVSPVMLPDSSIVYALQSTTGLIKIDKNGERLWKQSDVGQHHAINLGPDGTIWATTYTKDGSDFQYYGATFNVGGRELPFVDNAITQFDSETGEILYHKSVAEILYENDLGYLLVKSNTPGDPLHVNDVEPVLSDGPHFKQGDVFISARSGSWILHFRPSTGQVIEVITGPFESQHDVDIESDSTITLFNNNSQSLHGDRPNKWRLVDEPLTFKGGNSGLVRYYLKENRFEFIEQETFDAYKIFTFTEGLHQKLPGGGYFIEEQNSSVYYIIKDGEVLYKDVLRSQHEGHHHLANWARVMP
ncbi:MAG: hypothetical protein RL754_1068 [Bacteroidota bacterium]|jgi:hypothetical protein